MNQVKLDWWNHRHGVGSEYGGGGGGGGEGKGGGGGMGFGLLERGFSCCVLSAFITNGCQ